MPFSIEPESIPLEIDANGVIRVGGTRITLDTIVAAFGQGATAEEITHQYPSLHLADVYAVIAYYCGDVRRLNLICNTGKRVQTVYESRTNLNLTRTVCVTVF